MLHSFGCFGWTNTEYAESLEFYDPPKPLNPSLLCHTCPVRVLKVVKDTAGVDTAVICSRVWCELQQRQFGLAGVKESILQGASVICTNQVDGSGFDLLHIHWLTVEHHPACAHGSFALG